MKPSRKPEMRQILRARDGDLCFYCRTLMDFINPEAPNAATIEHLMNRSDRSDNRRGNLVLAGAACNSFVDNASIVEKIKLRERWPADAPTCTPLAKSSLQEWLETNDHD